MKKNGLEYGIIMIQQTIQYFTEREEEFVGILTRIGMQRNVAKMLVYLANVPEATSRQIERGADMRQPEVSTAAKHLENRGWIRRREGTVSKKGRPLWNYSLALPIRQITEILEKEKKKDLDKTMVLIRKLQGMV